MKSKLLAFILLASTLSPAMDSKSLWLGIAIGSGVYATRNHVAIPAAKASGKGAKNAAKATARGLRATGRGIAKVIR